MMGDHDILPQQHESDAEVRRYPAGIRHLARWVRLCERQGTRLVDLIERWVDAAEEHNKQAERLADAAEKLAVHADGYLGTGEYDETYEE